MIDHAHHHALHVFLIMSITLQKTLMPKVLKSTDMKLLCLSASKKLTSFLTSFQRYCKDIANLLFWELSECCTITIKKYQYQFLASFHAYLHVKNQLHHSLLTQHIPKKQQNAFVFICWQKINFIPMLLWRYCKDMQTYFGYFGHAWLQSTKMIVSPCRMLHFLSACKKSCAFFLRYYILKDRAI